MVEARAETAGNDNFVRLAGERFAERELGIGIIFVDRIAVAERSAGGADQLELVRRNGIKIADRDVRRYAVPYKEQRSAVRADQKIVRTDERKRPIAQPAAGKMMMRAPFINNNLPL
ncbi:hypothetical protein PACILC2_18230 [Paenibacillus cisolokensis]|uniref:Uncharacterized protein n=1 Tax=Paenibacillus cisolokensis TaxID=1658519 RepID=A0ABQ4N4X2_9BACL|nr:hypothetical protein PACILC2_18230 [Paenibacillus cisolokensis]